MVSLILFWAMIQMGMAVTVACLPTLGPLFRGVSLEGIIRSIRSTISLHSLRSRGSNGSYKGNNNGPKTSSSESVAAIAGAAIYMGQSNGQRAADPDVQTIIMGDLGNNRNDSEAPSTGILVNNKINHSVEQF